MRSFVLGLIAPFLFASCLCSAAPRDIYEFVCISTPIWSGKVIPAGQVAQVEEVLFVCMELYAQYLCIESEYRDGPDAAYANSDVNLHGMHAMDSPRGDMFRAASLNEDNFPDVRLRRAHRRIETEIVFLCTGHWSVEQKMRLAQQMGQNFAPKAITSPLNTFSPKVFDNGLVPSEFSMIDFSPLNRKLSSIRTIGDAKNAITDLFVLYAQCALMASDTNFSLFYKVAPYIYDAFDDIRCLIPDCFIADFFRDKKEEPYYFYRDIIMHISFDVRSLWNDGFCEIMHDKKLEFAAQVGAIYVDNLSKALRQMEVVGPKRRVDGLFIDGLSYHLELSSASNHKKHHKKKCLLL
jgi:hypothetical protein